MANVKAGRKYYTTYKLTDDHRPRVPGLVVCQNCGEAAPSFRADNGHARPLCPRCGRGDFRDGFAFFRTKKGKVVVEPLHFAYRAGWQRYGMLRATRLTTKSQKRRVRRAWNRQQKQQYGRVLY